MPPTTDIRRPVKEGSLTLLDAWSDLDYAGELATDVIGWRLIARLEGELAKQLAGPAALHIADVCGIGLFDRLGVLDPHAAELAHVFCESYPAATLS